LVMAGPSYWSIAPMLKHYSKCFVIENSLFRPTVLLIVWLAVASTEVALDLACI